MKKKILYLARSLEIGGLERVIVLLSNNIDRERFTPYICCIARAGDMAEALDPSTGLFVIGNEGRINLHGFRYIRDLIRKENIDLVHSHELSALLYGLPCAKLSHIPIIHTKHGYGGIRQEKRHVGFIGKLFSRSVTEYVCVSSELQSRMKEEIGIRESKTSVIYNGIEEPPVPEGVESDGNDAIVIGSVGRLNRVKNYGLLIRAFSEVLKRYPEVRLEFVGGGAAEGELKELAGRLSLSEKVVFHGYRNDVGGFFDRFDIFALTSIYEGLSISLLEAVSRSKICVVSDVGGNTEIIEDGINGLVFESGDIDGLVSRLSEAIEGFSTDRMEMLRNKARRTFEDRFSIEKMIDNYEKLYEKHLSNE